MSDAEGLIVDITTRIFRDLGDPQTIILAGDDDWRAPLWSALNENGLTRAWLDEASGGAGLSVSDTFALLRVAGAHAVALPLAETLLAGWALSRAGLEVPEGALAVAPCRPGERLRLDAQGRLSGGASAVPFARDVDRLAILAETDAGAAVCLIERAAARLSESVNLAGEPADTVVLDAVVPLAQAAAPFAPDALLRLGAGARASQMAGALQALLDMAVAYAGERVAFTRPIGGFQAVQHLLARLAEEVSASLAAANSVGYALDRHGIDGDAGLVEVAAAKIRAAEAAGEGAMIAHQVHGAIGFTDEHPLHRFAQRLWSWRDDFGDEAYWALRLGRHFAAAGGAGFWPALTAV